MYFIRANEHMFDECEDLTIGKLFDGLSKVVCIMKNPLSLIQGMVQVLAKGGQLQVGSFKFYAALYHIKFLYMQSGILNFESDMLVFIDNFFCK